MNIGYRVVTTILEDEILQVFQSEKDEFVQVIYRQLLKIGEQQTREALIKLGWTPPPEKGE